MRDGQRSASVCAKGVSVTLDGRAVLRNASLLAEPGEVLALLGPNGAGKTTFLKAIAGLLPYAGQVTIGDDEVSSIPPRDRAKRVAYVPQRSLLRSALSVEEVVALGRYVHAGSFGGMSRRCASVIEEALETAHATALRHRIFTQLSVGEQQRVLLARALASEAPVLLLDEPTAALDVGEGLAVLRLIRRLANSGHTLIVVVHDLADARSTTDRALLLDDGQVIERGPTEDVVSTEPVRRVYGVELIENARIGFESSPNRDGEKVKEREN
ncbi:MAG: ABC transporter ATP-binding protein [Myxococcota bacterium]